MPIYIFAFAFNQRSIPLFGSYRVKKIREEIFNHPSSNVRRRTKNCEESCPRTIHPFATDPTVERLILIRSNPDRETFLIDFPDTIINDK